MDFKYILDDYGNFAIFSKSNTHSDMAKGFYKKPVSAGFCRITSQIIDTINGVTQVDVECFGRSTSLGLESREKDSEIITRQLNSQSLWN